MSASPEAACPSVRALAGVGPRLAEKLERLGIRSVHDLLLHLPIRYQDRTRVTAVARVRVGDEAVIEGELLHVELVQRRRRMLVARLSDGTGSLQLRFFHFNAAQRASLVRGARLRCFGEIRSGAALPEIVHPEYQVLGSDAAAPAEPYLTPVYPTTEGLHQIGLRKLTGEALAWLQQPEAPLAELLPSSCLRGLGFTGLRAALAYVHRPPPDADVDLLAARRHRAQRRLAFEELVAHQVSLRRLRADTQHQPAPAIRVAGTLAERLEAGLPFALTAAQRRVLAEIETDLARARPMLRLLQGDVGSGKTVVAASACVRVIEAGLQAAVMAPTELLAEQHHRSFQRWLAPLDIETAWLSGRQKAGERAQALAAIASGRARLAVGTHALFQADVAFADLALVVVDEQHRFGVHQRLALRHKGQRAGRHPHQLVMTATPIPRTLAMTAYADLDYSVIDALPPGRVPIKTVALAETRREEVVERVSRACGDGRQAYWVCTLIEESEALQCQAAEDACAALAHALAHLRVGLVHGRMKAGERAAIMQDFAAGEVDLLVATTVIEVGVDVPNASLMIIENAERLGLAQLHQLRGRVGRGSLESSCVLMYRPPLSAPARQRLDALRATTDGFEIARVDLHIRGPGELLGTRQTGMLALKVADIVRDQDLLPQVTAAADRLSADHGELVEPLVARWLGEAGDFANV